MRRFLFWGTALLVAAALLSPLAAAAARVEVVDTTLQDAQGNPLAKIRQSDVVVFLIKLQNTGNQSANRTVDVKIHLESADKSDVTDATATKAVSLAPGSSTTLQYRWEPKDRREANYTASLFVEGFQTQPFVVSFSVAKSNLKSDDLGGLALHYWWTFAALVFAMCLFFVVLAVRKE